MKDFLTPTCSPFSLANGPATPSTQCPAQSAGPTTTTHCLPTSGEKTAVEELLFEKLDEVVVHDAAEIWRPFDLIPNEVLSLILEHGYLDRIAPPNAVFRAVVASISRRFREVTLRTPSLWSVIHLSPANVFDDVDVLPISMARSMMHPLDIHLSCFWASDLTEQMMKILGPQSVRWRQLSITIMNDYILKLLQHLPGLNLNALSMTYYSHDRRIALPSDFFANDLPTLAHLVLRNVDLDSIHFSLKGLETLEVRGHGIWPSFPRLNEMIGYSRLRHLILHVKPSVVLEQAWGSLSNPVRGQIHLPELSHMMVYTSEWLSEDIANLIQLFRCSNLQALVVREGVTFPAQRSNTVMGFTTSSLRTRDSTMPDLSGDFDHQNNPTNSPNAAPPVQPVLWIKAAKVRHACISLTYSGVSTIKTLVLSKGIFPPLLQLKDMFASLKSLESLSILNLIPSETLSHIMAKDISNLSEVNWEGTLGAVPIPKLKSLTIALNPSPPNDFPAGNFGGAGLKEFLLLFKVPSLAHVGMKHLTSALWRNVVEAFFQARYSNLTSLHIDTMFDPSPRDQCPIGFASPGAAFPNLETLSLKGVGSNAFLISLLGDHDLGMGPPPQVLVFPHLACLAIQNDPCASKPLLHRVIATRAASSRPLKNLYLDTSFTTNADSLAWMKGQVEVLEIIERWTGATHRTH